MKETIQQAIHILKKGGLLLYPTDTVWGIGCDATNAEAVDKIYALKQRQEEKAMICLVSDFKMLNQYVEEVPEVAYDILKYAAKPTTIVYDNPIRVAENVVGKDNTLGIRVCKDKFCNQLIRKFKKPIVSTSANFSGKATPKTFQQIDPKIIEAVDYVVEDKKYKPGKPSTVIKLSLDGKVSVIRK